MLVGPDKIHKKEIDAEGEKVLKSSRDQFLRYFMEGKIS